MEERWKSNEPLDTESIDLMVNVINGKNIKSATYNPNGADRDEIKISNDTSYTYEVPVKEEATKKDEVEDLDYTVKAVNKMIQERDIKLKEEEETKKRLLAAKKRSIEEARIKKAAAITRKKEIQKKRKIKRIAIITAATLAAGYLGVKTYNSVEKYVNMNHAESIIEYQTENKLRELGIDFKDKESLKNADYSSLKNISEKQLYGYYLVLGGNETEKILQYMGYNSWGQFLNMNGYFDHSGAPSMGVWINYMEAAALDSYINGNLKYNDTKGVTK